MNLAIKKEKVKKQKTKKGTSKYKTAPQLSTAHYTHHIVELDNKMVFTNNVNINDSHYSPDVKAPVIPFLEQYLYFSSNENHLHLLEL